MLSFVHEVAVQKFIPNIRNAGEAPVHAICVAGWFCNLLLCERNIMFPVNRRMSVLAVVGQLRYVQYLNMYTLLLQCCKMRLSLGHQAVICSCGFVSNFVNGLCFIETFVSVYSTPVASPGEYKNPDLLSYKYYMVARDIDNASVTILPGMCR